MAHSNEKFKELLVRLLNKTKAGQVRWVKNDDSSFRVWITDSSAVSTSLYEDYSSPDVVTVTLSVNGENAVTLTEEEGQAHPDDEASFLFLRN